VTIEIWILLLLAASGLSACIGYAVARNRAPSRTELDRLESELAQTHEHSETVQSSVNEHFEQSAVLFGQLAKDYREFLDHFSSSAQTLGLSETHARELLEQGFQPLLTHEEMTHEGLTHEGDPDVVEPAVADDGEARDAAGLQAAVVPDEEMVVTADISVGLEDDLTDPEAPLPLIDVLVEMPGESEADSKDASRRQVNS